MKCHLTSFERISFSKKEGFKVNLFSQIVPELHQAFFVKCEVLLDGSVFVIS
jgi:hypothetical protein